MGRHSDGQSNYKISGGVYAILACLLIAVIAVSLWFRAIKDDSETINSAECMAGNLTLPVAAQSSVHDIAQTLIDDYNATSPIVRDHCVRAMLTPSVAEAGVFISSQSDGAITAALAEHGRSPATLEWPTASALKVGVASTKKVAADTLTDVSYPVADNSVASALVAAAVNKNAKDKVTEILEKNKDVTLASAAESGAEIIATNEKSVPTGYSFTDIADLRQPVRVVALNATNSVNEEVVRAGADFGAAITNADAAKSATTVAALAAVEALHSFDAAHTSPPATAESVPAQPANAVTAANTLFLFDTSDQMSYDAGNGTTWFQATSNAIAKTSEKIAQKNRSLALWNYSSPLNQGVTRGWRTNIMFSNQASASKIGQTAIAFGTGGVPQTRSATLAAVRYGVEYAKEAKEPVRIVVITTGTADQGDLEALKSLMADAQAANTDLSVIHVGSGNVDKELADLANNSTTVSSPADLPAALDKASGV